MTETQYKWLQDNFVTNDTNGGGLRWKIDLDASSVTLSENIAQINGQTVTAGSGLVAPGTMRITLATDQAALTTAGVFSVKFDQTTPGTTNAVVATTKGDVADNAVQVNLNPSYIGARAEDVASLPTFTAGDAAGLRSNKDNGGVLVNQANLSLTQDAVGANIIGTSSSTGALSQFRSLTVNSTAQAVKASAGNFYRWRITNRFTSIIYVKLYNIAAGSVNPASDVPVATLPVPAGPGGFVTETMPIPMYFNTALSVRCVTEDTDSGTTAPGTLPIIEFGYL